MYYLLSESFSEQKIIGAQDFGEEVEIVFKRFMEGVFERKLESHIVTFLQDIDIKIISSD